VDAGRGSHGSGRGSHGSGRGSHDSGRGSLRGESLRGSYDSGRESLRESGSVRGSYESVSPSLAPSMPSHDLDLSHQGERAQMHLSAKDKVLQVRQDMCM